MNYKARSLMTSANLIFWDFDGVIKESVDVKTKAFAEIFLPYGDDVSNRVRQHHESHCGISRFEKIPLYLDWAGIKATTQSVSEYCNIFSDYIVQAVIDSPWVPGVLEYLKIYSNKKYFVLVTATPQKEIEHILSELNISECFKKVYGAPTEKTEAIGEVILRNNCNLSEALMIGDSKSDLHAANINSVRFLLRCTPLNQSLQADYKGLMINNFN